MKIRLAFILSFLLMFSSLKEGISQLSSILFMTENCCSAKTSENENDSCNLSDTEKSDTCCEGSDCDCTCCVHLSLFNTSLDQLTLQAELEKDNHTYTDTNGHLFSHAIFHPPLVFI